MPVFAIWGDTRAVGEMFDVVKLWREVATNVQGHGMPCGYLIPEEQPEGLLDAIRPLLRS